jgi:glycine/D-amino acid oxidase-like deaminating enzyme
VPTAKGLYIAAGHNCWGILWAPITGLCMAELLAEGKSSVDLAPFSPMRFMERETNRGRRNVVGPVGEQW